MLLATCIEPATVSSLNSLEVTAMSTDEQKIKTAMFSSRLVFCDFPGVTL